MPTLPATMRALTLHTYEGLGALRLEELPVPQPGPGQVLVKVAAAPANPSDLLFLEGQYGLRPKLPTTPGFEGSGVVVAAGGGALPRALVGRRVAMAATTAGGTWAEYIVTAAASCIPLLPGFSTFQGSMLLVNPLTAWALLDIARRGGQSAIVHTAAASMLGRMLVRLCRDAGMPLINVVRRPEQVELLRGLGAEHVLSSADADFDTRLRDLCRELGARAAFDAVAGDMPGRLLRAMPRGSRVTVYGALAGRELPLDPGMFIFRDAHVDGFWLSTLLPRQKLPTLLRAAVTVQTLLGDDLKAQVRACVPLEEARRGLELYATHMTEGKVLLVPGLRR